MEYESIDGHQISPLARLIPPYRREEYNRLLWDIQERGQQEPISRHRGLIIDGIHRLQVCVELGIEPRIVDLNEDEDPMDFVVTRNLLRRDLSKNQRACVAYALSEGSPPGRPALTENGTNLSIYSQRRAAYVCGVSVSAIKNVKRVLSPDSGVIPAIQQACWEDKVNGSDALNVIDIPEERQLQILDYVLSWTLYISEMGIVGKVTQPGNFSNVGSRRRHSKTYWRGIAAKHSYLTGPTSFVQSPAQRVSQYLEGSSRTDSGSARTAGKRRGCGRFLCQGHL